VSEFLVQLYQLIACQYLSIKEENEGCYTGKSA
jgi:hypothetical protein